MLAQNRLEPCSQSGLLSVVFCFGTSTGKTMAEDGPFAMSDESAEVDGGPASENEVPLWWEALASEGGDGGSDAVPGGDPVPAEGSAVASPSDPFSVVQAVLDAAVARSSGDATASGNLPASPSRVPCAKRKRGRPPKHLATMQALREEEAQAGPSAELPCTTLVPTSCPEPAPAPQNALVPLEPLPNFHGVESGMAILPHLGTATVDGYSVLPPLAQHIDANIARLQERPDVVDVDKVELCTVFAGYQDNFVECPGDGERRASRELQEDRSAVLVVLLLILVLPP